VRVGVSRCGKMLGKQFLWPAGRWHDYSSIHGCVGVVLDGSDGYLDRVLAYVCRDVDRDGEMLGIGSIWSIWRRNEIDEQIDGTVRIRHIGEQCDCSRIGTIPFVCDIVRYSNSMLGGQHAWSVGGWFGYHASDTRRCSEFQFVSHLTTNPTTHRPTK
jgi:hypothetical protein